MDPVHQLDLQGAEGAVAEPGMEPDAAGQRAGGAIGVVEAVGVVEVAVVVAGPPGPHEEGESGVPVTGPPGDRHPAAQVGEEESGGRPGDDDVDAPDPDAGA